MWSSSAVHRAVVVATRRSTVVAEVAESGTWHDGPDDVDRDAYLAWRQGLCTQARTVDSSQPARRSPDSTYRPCSVVSIPWFGCEDGLRSGARCVALRFAAVRCTVKPFRGAKSQRAPRGLSDRTTGALRRSPPKLDASSKSWIVGPATAP